MANEFPANSLCRESCSLGREIVDARYNVHMRLSGRNVLGAVRYAWIGKYLEQVSIDIMHGAQSC